MQNNLQLYHMILRKLRQWHPSERITRQRNLALLIMGLFSSASVHLSYIVRKWPAAGKEPSLVNRLHRFLRNRRLDTGKLYLPLAERLLKFFAGQSLRLVMDTTKVGFNHRALVVGLCHRRRTLPLAWSVHEGSIGEVAVTKQLALLDYVYQLVPSNCEVQLVGDSSFGHADLLRWLDARAWHYVLRLPSQTHVRLPGQDWLPVSALPIQEGQTHPIGWVWMTKTNPFGPVYLVLHWAKGEATPWYLVADQSQVGTILRAYKRRMWMEEMFGDMKGHGFDLEATHLRHAARIERLMLAVCIAFVWLCTLGGWVVKNGYRHLIDIKSRRDKSHFRLGWDWIERCFRLGKPPRLHFRPYL